MNKDLSALTAQVVASLMQNESMTVGDFDVAIDKLPVLIERVRQALATIEASTPVLVPGPQDVQTTKPDDGEAITHSLLSVRAQPAVPIDESLSHDAIICLEDGRKLKTLRRYLWTHYQLTPEQYREKWGLPKDYPMVAPSYAERRSAVAKQMGLGAGGRGRPPVPRL